MYSYSVPVLSPCRASVRTAAPNWRLESRGACCGVVVSRRWRRRRHGRWLTTVVAPLVVVSRFGNAPPAYHARAVFRPFASRPIVGLRENVSADVPVAPRASHARLGRAMAPTIEAHHLAGGRRSSRAAPGRNPPPGKALRRPLQLTTVTEKVGAAASIHRKQRSKLRKRANCEQLTRSLWTAGVCPTWRIHEIQYFSREKCTRSDWPGDLTRNIAQRCSWTDIMPPVRRRLGLRV